MSFNLNENKNGISPVMNEIDHISKMCGIYIPESLVHRIKNEVEIFILGILDFSKLYLQTTKRIKLTVDDIQNTLRVIKIPPLYGYSGNAKLELIPMKYSISQNLLIYKDQQINLKEKLQPRFEPYDLSYNFDFSWIIFNKNYVKNNKNGNTTNEINPRDITFASTKKFFPISLDLIIQGGPFFESMLARVSSETEIQHFLPQYADFISNIISTEQNDIPIMHRLIKLCIALTKNASLDIEPFVDLFVSVALTVLFHPSKLSTLNIREESCELIHSLCNIFNDLREQISDEFFGAIMKDSVEIDVLYGILFGYRLLGYQCILMKFLPSTKIIYQIIENYKSEESLLSTFLDIIGYTFNIAYEKMKKNQFLLVDNPIVENYGEIVDLLGSSIVNKIDTDDSLLYI